MRDTFDSVAQWNEALMRGRRAAEGRLPIESEACARGPGKSTRRRRVRSRRESRSNKSGGKLCTVNLSTDAPVKCQSDNPSAFCFCGSPEERRGVCHRAYDPFETPAQAKSAACSNPYDCYVKGPDDPAHPKDYSDYNQARTPTSSSARSARSRSTANACDLDCEEAVPGARRPALPVPHPRPARLGHASAASPSRSAIPTTGELIVSTGVGCGREHRERRHDGVAVLPGAAR